MWKSFYLENKQLKEVTVYWGRQHSFSEILNDSFLNGDFRQNLKSIQMKTEWVKKTPFEIAHLKTWSNFYFEVLRRHKNVSGRCHSVTLFLCQKLLLWRILEKKSTFFVPDSRRGAAVVQRWSVQPLIGGLRFAWPCHWSRHWTHIPLSGSRLAPMCKCMCAFMNRTVALDRYSPIYTI